MLKSSQARQKHLVSAIAVVFSGMGLVSAAQAAAPAVLTAAGKPQSVNSNEVKTTVLQVASFTLVADRNTTSNPNGQVSLSHTLTNTGNGTDTFTISAGNVAGDDFDFTLSTIKVYLDANNDGIADNSTNLNGTTISLAAGASTGLIVVTTTPSNAANDTSGKLSISATSTLDASALSNTDTVTVTGDAVVEVKKAASVGTVKAGEEIEYVLTYKNTGNSTATDVTITDVLPANVDYVGSSASSAGSALTDGIDADGFKYDAATRTITYVVPSLSINTTGSVKFRVAVKAAAAAGSVANTATFTYDPDNAGVKTPAPSQPTNTTNTTIAATYTGVINDSTTATDAVGNDDTVEDTISQGEVAVFDTYVHNNSNASESFVLSADTSNLPAGSTVTYFKADGVTPLSGSTTDTLAAGGSTKVVVKITLPSNYQGVVGTDNLLTTVTSSPVHDPAVTDTVKLVITDILIAGVDLTNGSAGTNPADGFGPYNPATIVDADTVEAGQPYSFPIAITNTGPTPDTFKLSSVVPAGWTVVFYEADDVTGVCTSTVAATDLVVAAGATNKLCAQVTPPANATPTTADVVFTATSTNTGSTDSLKDQLTVDENRSITFNPDNNGQVAPGGTVVYTHTITNNGNVTEGDDAGELLLSLNTPTNGFTTTVYVDVNNNGVADPTELLTGTDLKTLLDASTGGAGLQPGESIKILVKVEAPANAPIGQQETTTVTLTPTGAINGEVAPAAIAKTDATTVTDGQIRLEKTQALDTLCDGADGAFTNGVITAKPGDCVVYRIVATNEGNATVTSVVINDTAPAFTKLEASRPASNDSTTGSVSVAGNTATNTVGTMAPAAKANLLFTVKIDQ